MPGETPDWGALSAQATVFPVTDLGELAARLGSPVTHDRRGDVILLDSFEAGLDKWVASTSGTGAAVDLSVARARSGLYSCRLVGGTDGNGTADIIRGSPFATLSRFGFEISFHLPGAIDTFYLVLVLEDGTIQRQAVIRWRDSQNDLAFQDSIISHTIFRTGVDLSAASRTFHTAKVVIDGTLNEFVRFILDETESDLSGNPLLAAANSVAPRIDLFVQIVSRSGQNDVVYLDDAILTQNEPA